MAGNPFSGKKAGASKAPSSSSTKNARGDDFTEEQIEEMLPIGLARMFIGSQLEQMREEIDKLGLKAPEEYEGDMPELPDDIASHSHDELSNLMARFQNALSTATWNASVHYVQHNTFDEISDYLENRAVIDSEQSTEQKRKADARTDSRVVFFRSLHQHHYNKYVSFRDLAKTIDGKIKVVSRVGGFLGDEADDSDLKADKSSTRAKGRGSVPRIRSR